VKFLLDQGLPRTAAGLLTQAGLECVHIADIASPDVDDELILKTAAEAGRVVVTLDADFHSILALSGGTAPSVIRLRIEGLRAQDVSRLVQRVASRCEKELAEGALVSVDVHSVRVRTLPIT
jgi:predicted nuclease of predicted toxin-antitoxin system